MPESMSLVTGASGDLGYNLVKELIGREERVRAGERYLVASEQPELTTTRKAQRGLGVRYRSAEVTIRDSLAYAASHFASGRKD